MKKGVAIKRFKIGVGLQAEGCPVGGVSRGFGSDIHIKKGDQS